MAEQTHEKPKSYVDTPCLAEARIGELRHLDESTMLLTDGWVMRAFSHGGNHGISDNRSVGFAENFKHPDIQINYPLPGELALHCLSTVADLVKSGKTYKDGDLSDDVLHDLPVKFVAVEIDGVSMLRMILPDKEGNVERDKMAYRYSLQYSDI